MYLFVPNCVPGTNPDRCPISRDLIRNHKWRLTVFELEICCKCLKRQRAERGRATIDLYTDDGEGPFCVDCYGDLNP